MSASSHPCRFDHVIANFNGEGFAERLERAIARAGKMIDGHVNYVAD